MLDAACPLGKEKPSMPSSMATGRPRPNTVFRIQTSACAKPTAVNQ